jgi:signal peptidase II
MRLTVLVALAVLLLDQASKYWVVRHLDLEHRLSIDVLPPFLSFRMAWNQGINFGLFSNDAELMRWILIAIALAVSAWVWLWMRREPQSRLMQVAAGLLIGGALGNVVDRLIYGAVADFLNMSCCGIDNPFAFNLADVSIFAGAFGLVLLPGGGPPPGGRRAKTP